MTGVIIPEDARKAVTKLLRDLASTRRRQAMLARTKTDQRSHARLAADLETVAAQFETLEYLMTP